MSENVQRLRRREKIRDWCGALVIAAALSLAAALLVEVLVLAAGALSGHRTCSRAGLANRWRAWWSGSAACPCWVRYSLSRQSSQPGRQAERGARSGGAGGGVLPASAETRACILSRRLLAPYPDETLSRATPAELWLRWAGPLGEVQQKGLGWPVPLVSGCGQRRRCRCGGRGGCPAIDRAFSVAVLTGNNGVGKTHLTEALCLSLDGSAELAACGGAWARARLRLRRKLRQCLWWRPRADSDPWDYGYLVEDQLKNLNHLLIHENRDFLQEVYFQLATFT